MLAADALRARRYPCVLTPLGYAIIRGVAERTSGEVRISAGTLYCAIQRMQDCLHDRRRHAAGLLLTALRAE